MDNEIEMGDAKSNDISPEIINHKTNNSKMVNGSNQNQVLDIEGRKLEEIENQSANQSCWQKFEDWIWYHNIQQFEKHASLQTLGTKQVITLQMLRIFNFALTFSYMCYKGLFFTKLYYFTVWGLYLTLLSNMLGFISGIQACRRPLTVGIKEEQNEQQPSKNWQQQRHSCFEAWKYYVILQQMAFQFELQITPLYWFLDYPNNSNQAVWFDDLITHVLPLVICVLDFCMTPWPFTLRHTIFNYGCLIIYTFCVQIPYSVEVKTIYSVLDWKDNTGKASVLMAVLLIEAYIFNLVFVCVSKCKMRCYGQAHFIDNMK